ncbi:MAG: bifunctional glutamate N-acetyltransferase/amino-acid acetyltransferase ArgJ [Armatimonadetes bacterium]|nr:bifunctional glutamate N-acetyltransferase/amino-acid acetyltransferase ArgJ [Armatimonadota bacterium]NIM23395.1 bifunctional glutamate N-acetyltransferase/amino-acid acetyltransferase ArgJ [Armatimonadota bacterium]NIM67260.1 bifunctional glutamate N-acetyltransferase/amino-acid acetyltransferase ArgJ [Armatimonadota bacterium]NIM75758.1 bifunctional glutamate N-acetyltransferase/amino-acid acetyltransferase ArgJ [Armatimonadota bacterium]NIN05446.1 bifunctional glutamate N-acetyltransfera
MRNPFHNIQGGVCAPAGFQAAGVACGLKSASGPGGGRDLAVLLSTGPATCAGVFTTNRVKAWPVLLCQKHIARGKARAVVVNTGSANCMTGEQGRKDAQVMADLTAKLLGLRSKEVLVCSTGLIGPRLPMGKIQRGIKKAVRTLSAKGGQDAALAIMTTDNYARQAAVEFRLGGKRVRIGGMAKGAGMISPNMATMLAFITTDAALPASALKTCLKRAVKDSFNSITVDGEMSTNDTVLLFANGAAGISLKGKDLQVFQEGLNLVAGRLAKMIVEDGEGATKFISVNVKGAPSNAQAQRIARAIADSQLVKCAIHGEDPNWGRILSAAGASGVKFDPGKADLQLAGVRMIRRGEPVSFSPDKAHKALSAREVEIVLHLHSGAGCATIFTCDLSEEYVTFNAEYHT